MWAAAPLGEHILAVQPILSALAGARKGDPTGVGRLFPAKQRTCVKVGESGCSKQGGQTAADQEEAMRLIDVVLISAVIGMVLGLVQTDLPGARASGEATGRRQRLRPVHVRAHHLAARPAATPPHVGGVIRCRGQTPASTLQLQRCAKACPRTCCEVPALALVGSRGV